MIKTHLLFLLPYVCTNTYLRYIKLYTFTSEIQMYIFSSLQIFMFLLIQAELSLHLQFEI